jgi:hypothetical protein
MFKRAEQMEVAWSKVGAIRGMLEDFPLLLLHDNARPHTANKINGALRNFQVVSSPSIYYSDSYGLALSDERTGLSFVYAAGPRQRCLSRIRVPWDA